MCDAHVAPPILDCDSPLSDSDWGEAQLKFDFLISILFKFFEFKIKLFSLISMTSAISQLSVGSILDSSIFFFQLISLFLFVIGPLQP